MSIRTTTSARERGAVLLLLTMAVAALVASFALVSLTTSDSIARRVAGMTRLEKAAAIGESGLNFLAEQWRETYGGTPGTAYLDYTDPNGDGRATTAAENAAIGVARTVGGGTFTLLEIRDVEVATGVIGKVVKVRAVYDGVPFIWSSLLSQNLTAPIQGVGTTGSQRWYTGSKFDAINDGKGTVFGNGNLTVSGNQTIDGDVRMGGTVTAGSTSITGQVQSRVPRLTFPDKQAIIVAEVNEAKAPKPAGFWGNAATSLVVSAPLTAAESITANVTAFGTGWSAANTQNAKHLLLRGGQSSLPAGNYAFGRLWLDGSVLTIKAPPGGGTLVLNDVYLRNGARLILDTTDGPFTVVAPRNNTWEGNVGTTGAQRWNGTSWVNGAPSLLLDGTSTTQNVWNMSSGEDTSGAAGPKPDRGSTDGYDDWQIKDGSVFAVVTPNPNAKGFELFMQEGVDLVLANGARVMAGVQGGDLAALQDRTTNMTALDGMEQNAMGVIAWSGGGELPRLNINAPPNGSTGQASGFTGLTYGGFEATIGANGSLVGAFVGTSVDSRGKISYDARLAKLLTSGDVDSHHVVLKWREES